MQKIFHSSTSLLNRPLKAALDGSARFCTFATSRVLSSQIGQDRFFLLMFMAASSEIVPEPPAVRLVIAP